jgi:hypothetical protein
MRSNEIVRSVQRENKEKRRLKMVVENANINVQPVLTKEQVVYDEALKNMRQITARLKISQEGVNMESISDEKLTIASKLFDEMDIIQRDFNIEAQKIQQDVNNRMRILQEGANKKFGEVQNRYRELINSIKGTDTVGQEECSAQACDINMSKEKEEELKKMLAEELARAQSEKTE